MSDTVDKPNWWNDLGSFFSFSTPSSSSIDIDDLLDDLEDNLHGSTNDLTSSSFRSTQSNVIHKSGSNRSDTLISKTNADDLILGYGGFDFLSGGSGDDILHGGDESDFFLPGSGIDLVIGSDNFGNTSEKDTVSYHTATSGIVVEASTSNPFTYVSDDGYGDYDILYAVPNIFGSNFDDILHGRSDTNNILSGGIGDDVIYGAGGNNILIGGTGMDTIIGGNGVDTILIGSGGDKVTGGGGRDIFKFISTFLSDIAYNAALITDFVTGSSGDKLDVSPLLKAIGYEGSNPISDGYLSIEGSGSDTLVRFDMDGFGSGSAMTIATLQGVNAGSFSTSSNLVTNTPAFLYVPVLGQSNARALRVFDGDSESGLTRIRDGLESATDYEDVIIIPNDNTGNTVDLAAGGSIVVGEDGSKVDSTWWFADTGKPGNILIRAVDMMAIQIAELREQGIADIALVWGQGESDAHRLGSPSSESGREAAQQTYIDATLAVFDYIKDRLGDDITFYIMQTGRYNADAALLSGESSDHVQDVVDGLPLIHEAQEIMALERDDILLAASYKDLPMRSEVNSSEEEDSWHYEGDELEIIGTRLADFISLNLGYTNVIDDPGSYPAYVLADLDLQSGSGKTVSGNNNKNIIVGTDGNDILNGEGDDDLLFGGEGNDTINGGSGSDTAVFKGQREDYTIEDHGSGSYTITDNVGAEGTDELTSIETLQFFNFEISVVPPNVPVAQDDAFSGDQDTDIIGNVLSDNGNGVDSDPEGDPLNVIAGVYGTTNGSVTLAANGDFTYTPNVGYFGPDTFDYTLEDGQGNSDIGTVTFTVNGDDPDPPPPPPSGGTISGTDGDDTLTGGEGNDIIKGRAGNDTIIGGDGDDTLWGNEGDDIFIGGQGADWIKGSDGSDIYVYEDILDAGDRIVDFRPENAEKIDVSAILLDAPGFTASGVFDDGFLRLNQNGSHVEVFIDPDGLAGGSNETLLVTLENANSVDIGLGSFILPPDTPDEPPQPSPIATDDNFSGDEDTDISGNVLTNDSDPDDDPLSAQIETAKLTAQGGSVSILANGDFVYTPPTDFNGTDSFDYTLLDDRGGSDIGTVTLTLNPVNDNPTAQNDDVIAYENTDLNGNVLIDNGNGPDSDVDGDVLSVMAETLTTIQGVTVTLESNGDFTYTPPVDFLGDDSFEYTLLDGQGGEDTAMVFITVNEINHTPTAVDDEFTADEDTEINGNVLIDNGNGADDDIDGDSLSVQVATLVTAADASVILNGDGSFTYTPAADFNGADSFNYTLEDARGLTDTATVMLTLNPVNDNPIAQDDSFGGTEDEALSGNVLIDNGNGSDSDVDGDALSVIAQTLTTAQGATITLSANGDFTYTPVAGFTGIDGFDYTLLDGQGGNDIGSVTFNIQPAILLNTIEGTSGNDTLSGTADDDALFGYNGNDTLKGREGHDVLLGGDGSDTLWGNDGDDVLYGGFDADWMKGGDGADIFSFGEGAFGAVDTIADLRLNSGDAIELRDLLEGYDPLADAISDFVRITTDGSDSVVSVDANGSVGGESFTQIALILGITGLENESQLLADGALIIQNTGA